MSVDNTTGGAGPRKNIDRRGGNIKAIFAAAAVLPLFAGCAVGPDFKPPQPPANAGFTPTSLPSSTGSAPVHGGEAQHFAIGKDIQFDWWTLFQSPALNKLVEQAFAANPTIDAAQAALREAGETTKAQQGAFFPQVSAQFNASRNLTPTGVLSPASASGNPYYTLITPQLNVSFVPDVFGGTRRAVESLQAQADTEWFQLEATYVTLASNVVNAALQEASLREQIAAARRIINVNEKSLDILQTQFRAGYAMRIDVAAQEASLAQAKAALPPLQKQFEQTRDLIRALVGNLPNQDVPETFHIETLHLPEEPPISIPSNLIEQRPDVRAAEEQMHAASAQVGVAIANMLPQFSITAVAGGSAATLGNVFASGGPFWTLAGGATQPLFEGFTLLHRKRAADEALIQAEAQYRSAVITAFQNVADTLHALVSDASALSAAVDAERAAKVTLDLTTRQQQMGYVPYLTLLSAQQAYQQALATRVQAQATRYSDTAALYQALGGGWWNRTDEQTAAR
jgi:NodT family efflux transporter outer membrane factor (OMF) lipoprotein